MTSPSARQGSRLTAVTVTGVLSLCLSACAPVAYRTAPPPDRVLTPPPFPEPARPTPPAMPPPAPAKPRVDVPLKPAPPAIAALMREAEASRAGGQLDNAAATLERAIRIQPRNPQLWQELASLRLQQGQPGLAEDLAKKSNVLAHGNRALLRKNWSIIAEARRLKGDAEGAADADARAIAQ